MIFIQDDRKRSPRIYKSLYLPFRPNDYHTSLQPIEDYNFMWPHLLSFPHFYDLEINDMKTVTSSYWGSVSSWTKRDSVNKVWSSEISFDIYLVDVLSAIVKNSFSFSAVAYIFRMPIGKKLVCCRLLSIYQFSLASSVVCKQNGLILFLRR